MRRLFYLFVCVVISLTGIARAQEIEQIRQPLMKWVSEQRHAEPKSLNEFKSSKLRSEQFRALLYAALDRDWAALKSRASALKYKALLIHEAKASFIALSDEAGADPIVIVNLKAERDIVIQAPHVPFEKGTLEQAIVLLRDLGARAAIISGAHRCASKSFAACSGMTAVCSGGSGNERFRDSDAAHNTATLFQLAHELLADRWPNSLAISLHRMSLDIEGKKTSLIISNGIMADDDQRDTPATLLRFELAKAITSPGRVVSCNVKRDSRFDYRALCGFTNVQGRHLNRSADSCRVGVYRGTGRFIHLEQDRTVLDPYAEDWSEINNYPVPASITRALSKIVPQVRSDR